MRSLGGALGVDEGGLFTRWHHASMHFLSPLFLSESVYDDIHSIVSFMMTSDSMHSLMVMCQSQLNF